MRDNLSAYVSPKWAEQNVFQPDELKILTDVFESALKDLSRTKHLSEPDLSQMKRKLATLILIYARTGERDPDMLRQLAVQDLNTSVVGFK